MAEHTHLHAVDWFEIPVRELDRAQRFYEALLERPMRREPMGPLTLAVFASEETGVGGCLLAGQGTPSPSLEGTLIYLNAEPSIGAALSRVERAGGRVTTPKTQLPGDMGFFAHIVDTEGNRVGLHALA